MTAWPYGWVDVPHRRSSGEQKRWDGILNLEAFFDRGMAAPSQWGEALFGAFQWGFPDDVSERVWADYETLRAAGDPELVTTPRWASLSHLRAVWPRLHAIPTRTKYDRPARNGWIALMRILDILGRRYGEENVRMILWSRVVM